MTEQPHVDRAARLLRQARNRIAPARASSPDGAIAELSQTIRRSAARRRLRRGLLAGAAGAGACAAAVLVMLHGGEPARSPVAQRLAAPPPAFVAAHAAGATVDRAGGASEALAGGATWRPGDRLRSQGGPVELSGPDGTSLTLAASSELDLLRADAERWLRLAAGGVSVHVAKLKPGQRFVIVTPDAQVEVRGTRFHVDLVPPAPGCGQGTVTRVQVTEGVVEMRGPGGTVRVPAGAHWPASCPDAAPPPPAPARSRAHAAPARPAAVAAPVAARIEAPSSTLATENDLFSSALRAERAGDRREAIELLDVLLARFPHSPLQASAAAARDRLRRASSPAP